MDELDCAAKRHHDHKPQRSPNRRHTSNRSARLRQRYSLSFLRESDGRRILRMDTSKRLNTFSADADRLAARAQVLDVLLEKLAHQLVSAKLFKAVVNCTR